ncbi:MBL fold metallo-hydrolase [Rhodothermus profundi]|uniref:Glyoxylase, beta-lactamase superfamily II n=1 Tax=Rhodothermus profundi TaxID=633813 RepID=A0A1M6WVG0_9BACT|nr:MBL fold metallo-hydrolase [Rhodothermus profundi]SHK97727.1 Glyoxylase, beta-lactamase superfamily II [Rhodothermus profundi]
MTELDGSVRYLDLNYLGTDQLIACAVLEAPEGLLLVDPGPTSTLAHLKAALQEAGASLNDVRALLLTHIHLDHAGATGSIVAEAPHVQVFVHRLGAPHLVDPSRLLASARRLYGELMEPLWGAVLPVPESQVIALDGNERIRPGGRPLEVAYTPGHAVHHVSFLDLDTGTAFVGDTAGMQITGTRCVLPVAPPPDIQVEAWHESLQRIAQWRPRRLFVTHFGPSEDPEEHLDQMARRLDAMLEAVQRSLAAEGEDAQRADAFHESVMAEMRACLQDETLVSRYEQFGQPRASWFGLARYWRRKQEQRTS